METWTLSRERQHAQLLELRALFPGHLPFREGDKTMDIQRRGDLRYLMDHGLAEAVETGSFGSQAFIGWKITAKGIDFLEDDGGLTAILGVVTIKLHEDTLKTLIATKIEGSDLPQPEKHRWTAALRELPAESTKHLVLKLIDLGFAHGHEALHALGTFLRVGAGT